MPQFLERHPHRGDDLEPGSVGNLQLADGSVTVGKLAAGAAPFACTSTTRPSSPYAGQLIYERDTARVLVYNGTSWAPFVSNAKAVQIQPASLRTTTSLTYVDWPVTDVLTTSYTKAAAATDLICTVHVSSYGSGASDAVFIALNINGIDYDMMRYYHNALGDHHGWSVTRQISGIAAGTFTIKLRAHVLLAATMTLNVDGNDYLSMEIREVVP